MGDCFVPCRQRESGKEFHGIFYRHAGHFVNVLFIDSDRKRFFFQPRSITSGTRDSIHEIFYKCSYVLRACLFIASVEIWNNSFEFSGPLTMALTVRMGIPEGEFMRARSVKDDSFYLGR